MLEVPIEVNSAVIGGRLPPKYVPLEAVFIVILCKCPNPVRQAAVAVGLWIVWAGTLSGAVHTIHSLSTLSSPILRPDTLNVRQGRHIPNRRVTPLRIIVRHPIIHNRAQFTDAPSFQEQGLSLTPE